MSCYSFIHPLNQIASLITKHGFHHKNAFAASSEIKIRNSSRFSKNVVRPHYGNVKDFPLKMSTKIPSTVVEKDDDYHLGNKFILNSFHNSNPENTSVPIPHLLLPSSFLLLTLAFASNAEATELFSLSGLDLNGDFFSEFLFEIGNFANNLVQIQLDSLSPLSLFIVYFSGLVTSFSPCTLSVLPLTIGYIGGYESGKSQLALIADSLFFSFGLATTFSIFGIFSSFVGKAYGQIGNGLPIFVSFIAILMGLNLLNVISFQFPSLSGFNSREAAANFPPTIRSYLAGLTFAVISSPCSTPVLASLLAYVASTEDPLLGGILLFFYTFGYVTPLLIAASFTGALKNLLTVRKFSSWINPTSGALLVGGGLYSLLSRVFPETSMIMM